MKRFFIITLLVISFLAPVAIAGNGSNDYQDLASKWRSATTVEDDVYGGTCMTFGPDATGIMYQFCF